MSIFVVIHHQLDGTTYWVCPTAKDADLTTCSSILLHLSYHPWVYPKKEVGEVLEHLQQKRFKEARAVWKNISSEEFFIQPLPGVNVEDEDRLMKDIQRAIEKNNADEEK